MTKPGSGGAYFLLHYRLLYAQVLSYGARPSLNSSLQKTRMFDSTPLMCVINRTSPSLSAVLWKTRQIPSEVEEAQPWCNLRFCSKWESWDQTQVHSLDRSQSLPVAALPPFFLPFCRTSSFLSSSVALNKCSCCLLTCRVLLTAVWLQFVLRDCCFPASTSCLGPVVLGQKVEERQM